MAKIKTDFSHYFKINPRADKIFVTEDGQVFYPSAINFLKAYAREKGVNYTVITKAEALKAEKSLEDKKPENKK